MQFDPSAREVSIGHATRHHCSNAWIGTGNHLLGLSVGRWLIKSGVVNVCHAKQA
jgi:hypothetical protein